MKTPEEFLREKYQHNVDYENGKYGFYEVISIIEEYHQVKNLNISSVSVAVNDVLAFAEYFHNNFDYYDCNANGRVYKWIDLQKRGQSAMTMKQIFDDWQSCRK